MRLTQFLKEAANERKITTALANKHLADIRKAVSQAVDTLRSTEKMEKMVASEYVARYTRDVIGDVCSRTRPLKEMDGKLKITTALANKHLANIRKALSQAIDTLVSSEKMEQRVASEYVARHTRDVIGDVCSRTRK